MSLLCRTRRFAGTLLFVFGVFALAVLVLAFVDARDAAAQAPRAIPALLGPSGAQGDLSGLNVGVLVILAFCGFAALVTVTNGIVNIWDRLRRNPSIEKSFASIPALEALKKDMLDRHEENRARLEKVDEKLDRVIAGSDRNWRDIERVIGKLEARSETSQPRRRLP